MPELHIFGIHFFTLRASAVIARFRYIRMISIEQLYEIYQKHPSVQTDTRLLKPGDIFFALKGPNFNGNTFAPRALELGAAYAVIDEKPMAAAANGAATANGAGAAGDIASGAGSKAASAGGANGAGSAAGGAKPNDRLLLVGDVLTTLQDLALHHRKQFDIPFIAITGSNGKTTTKELVHAVLATEYITYTTKGNLNNHIGVPLTLLSVRRDAEFAVIEMGANHQQEIAAYCRYALPTHGIITNIGRAHLEGFGGPEGVKKGKGELYDHLRDHNGAAFVLRDSDDLRQMSRGIPHIITYGTRDADYTGEVAAASGAAATGNAAAASLLNVNITHGATTGVIHTQLVGDYNLPNILVAVAVGKHFGVGDVKIRKAIEQYTPSNSRSQLIEKDGRHIILDAYNANPSSMRAAIENFAKLPVAPNPKAPAGQGFDRKILILGAMAELGPESLHEHQGIVGLIDQYPWRDVVLVGGDFLKVNHQYKSFANSKEAAQWFKTVDLKDAWLLIKGSRSSKMEAILAEEDQPKNLSS
jgi:UDP-N-acetylmuramoyl-tripeptide--D-alanyl-D-alanine ligase